MNKRAFSGLPDVVTVFTDKGTHVLPGGESSSHEGVGVSFAQDGEATTVRLTAETEPVRFVRLRWNRPPPPHALFLGDAWERTYGDAQWRGMDGARLMPWYFLMTSDGRTDCCGVKTGGGSFALWSADPAGITLWLDVRCGGAGVRLGRRELEVATFTFASYEAISAFDALRRFCRLLCPNPLLPPAPVYGSNNWYYAYGRSSAADILADCRYLASLTAGLENRPFMVIDSCWQEALGEHFNGGPWTKGNDQFPDMPGLAAQMSGSGARPGIWFRPLYNRDPSIPASWRLNRDGERLDPSRPEVLEWVQNDIRRFVGWGFELIKHDFTTFDIFGQWGFQMNPLPARDGWSFADRGRTSAEIIVAFYQALLVAAGDALILGCNTVNHLGAGLMQLARIGDDTSGLKWERTRKMGVNTLAFRLAQHGAFFAVDADCVGVTGDIPWRLNRQWTELLARSGTPFFASLKPGVLNAAEQAETRNFFALASKQNATAEPLDWLADNCPREWALDGKNVHFDWYEDNGANPDFL